MLVVMAGDATAPTPVAAAGGVAISGPRDDSSSSAHATSSASAPSEPALQVIVLVSQGFIKLYFNLAATLSLPLLSLSSRSSSPFHGSKTSLCHSVLCLPLGSQPPIQISQKKTDQLAVGLSLLGALNNVLLSHLMEFVTGRYLTFGQTSSLFLPICMSSIAEIAQSNIYLRIEPRCRWSASAAPTKSRDLGHRWVGRTLGHHRTRGLGSLWIIAIISARFPLWTVRTPLLEPRCMIHYLRSTKIRD